MRKIILTILLLFLFFVFSGSIQAVTDTIVEYPNLRGATKPGEAKLGEELPEFVKYIFVFSLGAVGVTALIVIIIAAFGYVTSVGNPQKAAAAKDRIAAALLGILLLLGSYLLLRTINPDLLRLGVKLKTTEEITTGETGEKWYCYYCCYAIFRCDPASQGSQCSPLWAMPANEAADRCEALAKQDCSFPSGAYVSQASMQPCPILQKTWMCILENVPERTCPAETPRLYAGCKESKDACETYCEDKEVEFAGSEVYGCIQLSVDECLTLTGTCY